jgi:hypothetical protein
MSCAMTVTESFRRNPAIFTETIFAAVNISIEYCTV